MIFPAGGVSTAPLKFPLRQFARANNLPGKNFAYRLIRAAEATVLPLYFAGQNGPIFHAANSVSMAWRIALLVGQLNKRGQASAGAGRPPDLLAGIGGDAVRGARHARIAPTGLRAGPQPVEARKAVTTEACGATD